MFSRKQRKFQQELEKVYDDGEVIVREGDRSREMYVIQEGAVVITKSVGDKDLVLRRQGKGDFFGEMSLLESEPRSATARAVGHTTVVVIQSGGFLLKIRRDPTFAFEMLQRMSGRIRQLSDRLAAALDEEAETKDQLESLLARSRFGTDEEGGRGEDER